MVSGPGAVSGLEWLCTGLVSRDPGTCTYTLMLNPAGGIECDVTVTRTDRDSFYIVTGAAALQHTHSWIARTLDRAGYDQVTTRGPGR